MAYIEIRNMSKKIKENLILDNINCEFEKGNIYGIFGRNASGKTMLFRAICGLIRPTEGEVLINNKILGKEIDFPDSCGVLLENPGFWQEYTAFQNLKQLAKIKGIIGDEEIYKVIERVGLDPRETKKYKKFSLGMKQKLGIAQAIMEKPDIIILDEPTNALDEESVENIRKIIKEEKERGAVVLIASHSKEDIELLSDLKFKMDCGKLTFIKR